MSRKTDNLLQQKLLRSDPKVKLGDTFRRDDVRLVLVWSEDDDDFIESGKAACVHCSTLLATSNGNHIKRHLEERCKKRKRDVKEIEEDKSNDAAPSMKMRKITEYSDKKFREVELAKVSEGLAKYCLRSGRSYNHLASNAIRELIVDVCNAISCGYGSIAMEQLPSRQTIQKISEKFSKKLIEDVFEKVRPYVGSRVNLLVDHGRHVVNYLSIFASFIDKDFHLQVIPLAFTPCLEKKGKSGSETALVIQEKLGAYGWTIDEIESCHVTADGALSTLGAYFASYVRCVSHSLHLVAQKILHPLEKHKDRLKPYEDLLNLAIEVLKNAQVVCSSVRTNSNMCSGLSRLPALYIETRWMSSVICLKDVVELSDEISASASQMSAKGRQALNKLTDDNCKEARSILEIMKPLLEYNSLYQTQNAVTLHLVLPSYKFLETKWKSYAAGDYKGVDSDLINADLLTAMSESGLSALSHYYAEFGDIHFAAVLLSPRTKKMKNFDACEIDKARRFVISKLPKSPSVPREMKKPKEHAAIANLLMIVSDSQAEENENDEMERYLSEHVDLTINESLEDYWRRKQNEYPALFEVAAGVFSIVPSEAVCETCFSVAAYLLDKRRTRLQYARAELIVIGSQLASKFPYLLK